MLRGKLLAFGVGEDAVSGAGDVAQMESDGRKAERLRVNFGVGQAGSPFGQVVEREVERVKNSAARGGDVGIGAAEPGFGVGSCVGAVLMAQSNCSRVRLLPRTHGLWRTGYCLT